MVRYLEIATLAGRVPAQQGDRVPCARVGLDPPRDWLDARIMARVRQMVADGVLAETAGLLARDIDPGHPSMTGHGYVHWAAHLRGEATLEAAIEATAKDVRAYSRRQMTWFRRDPAIRWVDPVAADPLQLVVEATA